MGKVIFNSDDFGYSHGVNYGIMDAHQRGILTSTTLMANMPGFEHAVSLKKELPKLGVGVHLTLTCGRPLLQNITTIVDEGCFKKLDFYQQDFLIDWDELYAEWDAQIKKVYQAGITPTHLDSHHHTHTLGKNQEVVIELAKKYDLPVRGNFQCSEKVRHTSYFEPFFDDVGEREIKKLQIKEDINDYLDKLLIRLQNEESSEVMCHTAYIDESLYDGTSFLYPRIHQVEFLIYSEFAKKIRQDSRIQLVTYRSI